MLAGVPFALAGLVALVAWGVGGWAPWASLALELGAIAIGGWLFVAVLVTTTDEARERYLALGRSQRRQHGDAEILGPPASSGGEPEPFRDPCYFLGFPFRSLGAGRPLRLLTLWVVVSLCPLPAVLLSWLSPAAFELRSQAAALARGELSWAPLSVTPFLTFQDLLLWIAYLSIFLVAYHVSDSSRAARRLSAALVLVGTASGAFGLFQWLSALASGAHGELMATGSFGNRNHYAYFQEMLLMVGAGFLAFTWERTARRPGDRMARQEAKARTALMVLAIAAIALGLVFSLSRSGIAFSAVGLGAFLVWTRPEGGARRRGALAVGLVMAAAVLWIGLDPVVERFELAPSDLADDAGRAAVWRDSLDALGDFWLTGSGLSSFQYVYPIYRGFGGRSFYSWAHNDYLQLAIELGLPGLLLAIGLIVWAVRRSRVVRERLGSDPPLRKLHAGYCAGLLAVALHSFTDFGLHLPANAALFAILAGVATGLSPSRRKRRSRSAPLPV